MTARRPRLVLLFACVGFVAGWLALGAGLNWLLSEAIKALR